MCSQYILGVEIGDLVFFRASFLGKSKVFKMTGVFKEIRVQI